MKVVLDEGLALSAAELLRREGYDAIHVRECGLARALDADILAWAREQGALVVTLDADFHALLMLTGAKTPSVVRIRIQKLRAWPVATLIRKVLTDYRADLESGSMVVVEPTRIRVRRL